MNKLIRTAHLLDMKYGLDLFKLSSIDEDEYGDFISIENMNKEEFLEWCKEIQNIEDKDSPLYQMIARTIVGEIERRKASGEL